MSLNLLRYEVEDAPFGRGGMGEVYKGKDRLSGEEVAIKTINQFKLDADDKTIRTFMKEAEASFKLGHQSPFIVKVSNIGLENDTYFMIQEFMDGGNILPKCGKVSGAEAKQIILQALNGLKVAHSNKIVHSDISPDNILFSKKEDKYKLSDFGLLKIIESHLVTRGHSIHAGGKPHFLPKAHFFDPALINEKSDFYAIGMVYHFLLTGKIAHGTYPNPPQIQAPFKIAHNNVDLHPHGINFLNACFNESYANVDQLIKALSAVPNQ
ncbi:MAG: serine/threonine-protein kinase [Dehalococcoidales bacterium]|nr:serine/threonine-protein kinase [Dehalococcoidales bacterium]